MPTETESIEIGGDRSACCGKPAELVFDVGADGRLRPILICCKKCKRVIERSPELETKEEQ